MPVVNRFAEFQDDIVAWRHEFHRHPEILYDVQRTAASVADKLRSFGVDEVTTGIGRTGVVGVIRGRGDNSGRVVGLRADMDALPIREATGKPYASTIDGRMHACGHDGHTAMLLGAARYLAETRNFDGTAVVIFQPAEEGGGGGKAMIEDGLIDRWGIEEVYGMHNMPGMPVGEFAIRPGPIMAATDEFTIEISGVGGHAARPHATVDPVVVGAAIVQALQTVVSRSVDPVNRPSSRSPSSMSARRITSSPRPPTLPAPRERSIRRFAILPRSGFARSSRERPPPTAPPPDSIMSATIRSPATTPRRPLLPPRWRARSPASTG